MSDDAQGWNLDGLSPDEQQRFTALYGSHPQGAAPTTPGFFTGWYKAAAGIPSGLANVGLDVAKLAVNPPDVLGQQYRFENPGLDDDATPIHTGAALFDAAANSKQALDTGWSKFQEPANQWIDQAQQSANEMYRPDPQTTGLVGNTLFGAADVVTRVGVGNLLAPGAGLGLAAGTTGYERTKDLEAQGVDPETAAESGLLTAGSLMAMGGVAGLGKTAVMRALTGAGTNIAFGAGSRALDSAVLRANGYEAQAAQQQWNDAHSMIADGLIGAAFGFLPHSEAGKAGAAAPEATGEAPTSVDGAEPAVAPEAPNAPPSQPQQPYIPADLVDAALVAKNAQHVTDVAPGVPADPRSAQQHIDALDTATDQLLDGQPVDVDPIVRGANFVPRPGSIMEHAFADALQAAGVSRDDYIESMPTEPNESIEQRFGQQLQDHDQSSADYAAIPETLGGKVLNTDIARELSPDYLLDRTRSAAVHEPASTFIKRLFAEKLAQEPGNGEDKTVTFTAGGTGAGKTSGIEGVPELRALRDQSHVVYDTNMNKFGSADAKIQQALGAGHKVNVVYTYRDPVEALVNGALPRAERQREQFGTGRTVPLAEHYKTHVGAYLTVRKLAEKYRDNPGVDIYALDNSRGKGQQQLTDLNKLHVPSDTSLRVALSRALRQEYDSGRISEATYRGFAEGEPDDIHSQVAGELRQGLRAPAGQEPELPGTREGLRGVDEGQERPAGRAPRGSEGESGAHPNQDDLNPASGGVSASGDSIRSSDAAYGTPARHPWVEVDDTHNIPYAGGVNAAGDTVYLSQYMPDTVEAGGKTIDAKESVFVHEVEEQKVMHPDGPKSPEYMKALRDDIASESKLNPKTPKIPESDLAKVEKGEPLDYVPAHNIATVRENAFIRAKYGTDPELYQKALADGITEARRKAASEGGIPADLDTKSYENEGQRALLQGQGERVEDAAPAAPADADAATGSSSIGSSSGDAWQADDVARARQVVASRADEPMDDGGTVGDAWRAADEDAAEAGRQADGVKAAVACFLSFGSDL